MAKTKISEFSSTPANNTDIDSINIAEGCAPSGINDAIRELMAQLKDFQTGAVGDSFNGPIGAATASTGAFTTLSATGAITSTLATGTAPFTIASTTKVSNLNVDLLDGADWASPAALGSTTPAAGAFTTLSASSTLSVTGAGSIQGLTVGRGAGSVSTNTAVGANALANNSTGAYVTGVGYQALQNNTGSFNTAVGGLALTTVSSGFSNTGIGTSALRFTTTGNYNAALGQDALTNNTTGSSNVSVGYMALQGNTTANNNTAVGYQAGYNNQTGAYNTFLGRQAGYTSNVSGNGVNTCVGDTAGYALITGTYNTFVGPTNSGGTITTGSKNTILGGYTGNQGGLDIRTASNYIVLSDGDGNPRAIWDNNGYLVMGATSVTGADTTQGVYFYPSNGTAQFVRTSNAALDVGRLTSTGNCAVWRYAGTTVGSVSVTGSATAYNTSSDYRLKDNPTPLTGSGAFIDALQPKTWTWKADGSAGAGFIAHEAQEVSPSSVVGIKDAVDEEGKPIMQAMEYGSAEFIANIIAELQSLRKRVAELEAK